MKEVWFIRHAQTGDNIGLTSPTIKDIELSEEGFEQAIHLTESINKEPDLIVVTPYTRTEETAKPLCNKFPDTPVETWSLQEFTYLDETMCINSNEEMRKPMRDEYWKKLDPEYIHGTGAESFSNMISRIKSTLNKIENSSAEFIIIFTHGLILRNIITMVKNPNLSNSELMKLAKPNTGAPKIENCQIVKTKYENNSLKLLNF